MCVGWAKRSRKMLVSGDESLECDATRIGVEAAVILADLG
jgi:hypothetical protein